MLFNRNKVKNTLKSIKKVLKNIKYLIISLWKRCGKPRLICGKLLKQWGIIVSVPYKPPEVIVSVPYKRAWTLLSKQAYTKERKLSTPKVTKSPQIPHKSPQNHINTLKVLDNDLTVSYSTLITPRSTLMSIAYQQAQKQRYRVTLELDVLSDFDPHNLDWEKVFNLEPAEKVSAYVEDLSTPDRW